MAIMKEMKKEFLFAKVMMAFKNGKKFGVLVADAKMCAEKFIKGYFI